MIKKVFDYVKDILSADSIGVMVVNGSYYRPMTKNAENASLRRMSDTKYCEILEQLK